MSNDTTFIVPTLRRPEHLTRCLRSIGDQTLKPQEVLVGIRQDDEESRGVLQNFVREFPIREVEARGVGVVGSMSSCLAASNGSLVALLDDDVELPPQWLERMCEHLRRNRRCVGVGGRDILLDYPEVRRSESLLHDVGRIHWYGRITGNHHRAGGEPRPVDALRGSNILFRGDFLRKVGFESSLRGSGAQVSWEIAIALQAMAEGSRMFFDPSIEVLHHVAPRHDDDTVHRGEFSAKGTEDMAFNDTYVVLRHAPRFRRLSLLLWQAIIGTPACPGLVRSLECFTSRRTNLALRFGSTFKGRFAAVECFARSKFGCNISSC